jgi:hypothetical protein
VDHEKSGIGLADTGRRAELRRLMELGQHYPSAFNAALVSGVEGAPPAAGGGERGGDSSFAAAAEAAL